MDEPLSIFQKEEALLAFGERFLTSCEGGQEAESWCLHAKSGACTSHVAFITAFKRVFKDYKKLFRQMGRLIRLSDRQQLKLDNANQSLKESQAKLQLRNEFIRSIFSRYMSDEVVESILETPEGLSMGGEKREVVVVMSDLRGFTAISETLPAEQVVNIVNLYLEIMTEIIFNRQGTINSFLGDGIMILFGAPIARDDDVKRAVACALEMQLAMPVVNAKNRALGYPELSMGIGIHAGPVVVGNIGSQKRSHYTVMGRVVNLAARIESYAIGGQVLISDQVWRACHPLLRIDDSMEVAPKGMEQLVLLHQVSAIGAPYRVFLDVSKKAAYPKLMTPLPVLFALLVGKHVGALDYTGEIDRLSLNGAKLRTQAVVPALTNIKIAIQQDGRDITQGLLGKVVRGSSDDVHTLEVAFTFVPDVAKRFIEALAVEHQPPVVKESFSSDCSDFEVCHDRPVEPTHATEVAAEVVAPFSPPETPETVGQDSRASPRRRHTRKIALGIRMKNGRTLKTVVGDYSLAGLFLETGVQKRPSLGAQGSFDLPFLEGTYPIMFGVTRCFPNGIGIKILRNHDLYAMAVAEEVFGPFLPVER